jgi:hypothetical protein
MKWRKSIATEMRCPRYGPVYPRLRLNSAHRGRLNVRGLYAKDRLTIGRRSVRSENGTSVAHFHHISALNACIDERTLERQQAAWHCDPQGQAGAT